MTGTPNLSDEVGQRIRAGWIRFKRYTRELYDCPKASLLWGTLYADDAGVVSQSPEQLRKVMGMIVVVCAAFGLTVSEAKTEIMCLRAKGMPESTATLSVEAAGQVYNQTY